MYEEVQQALNEKQWPLYKYWPQGLFARIFYQCQAIDGIF